MAQTTQNKKSTFILTGDVVMKKFIFLLVLVILMSRGLLLCLKYPYGGKFILESRKYAFSCFESFIIDNKMILNDFITFNYLR